MAALRPFTDASAVSEQARRHYVYMARKRVGECSRGGTEVKLKKLSYVLWPLLAARWIEQGRAGAPPILFHTLVDAVVEDPALRSAI